MGSRESAAVIHQITSHQNYRLVQSLVLPSSHLCVWKCKRFPDEMDDDFLQRCWEMLPLLDMLAHLSLSHPQAQNQSQSKSAGWKVTASHEQPSLSFACGSRDVPTLGRT